jgi:hypothetical protein
MDPVEPPVQPRQSNKKSVVFTVLLGVVILIVFFILLAIVAPSMFVIVINIFWLILLGIVLLFLLLGLLVLVGMRSEVNGILSIMLEGSLSILDLAAFIRFAGLVYFGLLYLYKYVGKTTDVTLLTAALASGMLALVAILNRNRREGEEEPRRWRDKFLKKFRDLFGDAIEVVIFIFFLTMDSTNLFFLPKELNVPLHAEFQGYDLMTRSFIIDENIKITTTLIIVTIAIEIVRFTLRLVIGGVEIYNIVKKQLDAEGKTYKGIDLIKYSIRESFKANGDDIMKFIAFTTVLILVFLLFPRLKLFAMMVASITAIVLDFAIPQRLKIKRQEDLISKIITKVFKL